MADSEPAAGTPPGKPITPSWKQVGLVLLAGIILVPGLCFGVVAMSSAFGSGGTVMDNAGSVVVILLLLSIVLTLGGGVLAVVRVVKGVRRR
jgi:hypothetical protein